jgi:phosphatidylglycerol lysyltransferase
MSSIGLPPNLRIGGGGAGEKRAATAPGGDPSLTHPAHVSKVESRLDSRSVRVVPAPKFGNGPHFLAAAIEQVDVDADELRQFVFNYGQCYDSYLATEPGRLSFWSPTGPGLVSYALRGKYVVVGGGLIAPDEHRSVLLREFVKFVLDRNWEVSFHNIGDADLPAFRQLGFQITKWGEEPIVDLGACTWSGKPFEWVRRQTNFCIRNGVQAFEVVPQTLEPDQWSRTFSEILEVSAESLSNKAQINAMKFFEGRIDNHELGLRRLYIARSTFGAGRIEGFLVCNPMREGAKWATELYRRRIDSVRGTMAFLIHYALQQMQAEGVQQVGLCLDPGRHCDTPLPGDSFLLRRGLQFGHRHLNVIFDVAGLSHFKGRFRPRYENRYVCTFPKVSIRSTLAFASVSGLLRVNPVKVARICFDHWRKSAARQSLATGHS